MADCISDILSEKAKERFWDNVSQTAGNDECWPWLGAVDKDGYGKFSFRVPGKRFFFRSSQVALMLSGQPRPYDRHALHACDNPPCCNPYHLRWGTQKENTQDMLDRGRQLKGEQNKASVLTSSQVYTMRTHIANIRKEYAALYGVSLSAIQAALTGETWGHID